MLGVAAVVAALLVWRWIAGWGLVTIDVSGESLAKVIRSIERQGGVVISSNVDPETPLTMAVVEVPVAEAVDYLAARIDARWSVAYVAGSGKAETRAGVDALLAGGRDPAFTVYGVRGWGVGVDSESVPDPRRVAWVVSPADDGTLGSYLDQAAQKTGVTTVLPVAWNPSGCADPRRRGSREGDPQVGEGRRRPGGGDLSAEGIGTRSRWGRRRRSWRGQSWDRVPASERGSTGARGGDPSAGKPPTGAPRAKRGVGG